jgi:hypothetical protein
MLPGNAANLGARLIVGEAKQLADLIQSDRLMTLFAFSLPSFAVGIAGVASGLPLGFHGGFARGPLC